MKNPLRKQSKFSSRTDLWCYALTARQTVATSLKTALVVGPVLTLINQWEAVTGTQDINWFKFGLTFLVPYLVATYSAAANLCRALSDES